MENIIAVITGDVIDSRKKASPKWLKALKGTLEMVFPEGSYQIFRGDSFQVIIREPETAMQKCIILKSAFRKEGQPAARIALGLGSYDYISESASESNGEAFILSGKLMDKLTKARITMGINSPWEDFNLILNTTIRLGLIAMDDWTKKEAEIIYELFNDPKINQTELSIKLDKSQSTISERIKRSYYHEVELLEKLYREQLSLKLQTD